MIVVRAVSALESMVSYEKAFAAGTGMMTCKCLSGGRSFNSDITRQM